MERFLANKKMMWVVFLLLPSLAFTSLRAQEPIVLDLDKALEIALSENPTVKVADQEIEKRKYAKKGSYAALFPQINFGADYTRTLKKQMMYMDGAFDTNDMMGPVFEGIDNTFAQSVPGYKPGTVNQEINNAYAKIPPADPNQGIEVGRDNNWGFGFNASMPLINASLWKSLSISGLDVELAIEQARSSKINMVNQVTKSFYGVLLANDSYRVFKESYDNAMENYQDVKQKYEQGLVAEYDLIRADVSVQNAEPNMLQAENALALATWQLKALLGMDLELPIRCEGKLSDFESNLYGDYMSISTALDNNTSLRQLDIQADQLKQTLKMQKFDYLPTLSLSALYNWNAMNNNFKFSEYKFNPYSTMGLTLTIPIFSGGSRYHNVKQTQVSITQMYLQRDDMERNLQLAVKQYTDNMSTCIKRYDAAQKGVSQAERGYTIAQKRYETGAGTLLELNDAELAMTQARLNFNQAIYDYMVAKADLELTVGNQNY